MKFVALHHFNMRPHIFLKVHIIHTLRLTLPERKLTVCEVQQDRRHPHHQTHSVSQSHVHSVHLQNERGRNVVTSRPPCSNWARIQHIIQMSPEICQRKPSAHQSKSLKSTVKIISPSICQFQMSTIQSWSEAVGCLSLRSAEESGRSPDTEAGFWAAEPVGLVCQLSGAFFTS